MDEVCRKLGGPLTSAGLAAAAVLLTQGKRSVSSTCFKCGQVGHLKPQCPERGGAFQGPAGQHLAQPDICPRCKKGKHWANEYQSVKDINGQPLPQTTIGCSCPKNGQRGPRPRPGSANIWGGRESEPRQEPGDVAFSPTSEGPWRATEGSVGLDLHATTRIILTPQMGIQ